jgi:hypothetical protein
VQTMVRADTPRWYNVPETLYQRGVSDSALLTTYHSLHIQYLQRSSWGWTVKVRNMYSWHLSTNKNLISAATLCISLECIYIAKMIRGPSNVKSKHYLCGPKAINVSLLKWHQSNSRRWKNALNILNIALDKAVGPMTWCDVLKKKITPL